MIYKYEDRLKIRGGSRLNGEITVQTSKNACLPILSASIISNGVVRIDSCPDILDVQNMIEILAELGVSVRKSDNDYILDSRSLNLNHLDFNLCKTMRSSIFLLGAILTRCDSVMLTTPGGCNIGERPIDIHLKAFKKLGVTIRQMGEYIFLNAKNAHAGKVKLKLPSVGATENIVQFASTLKGKTTIYNAAREPEVVDLCNFLSKMGAKIIGAGTKKITIYGVDRLHGTEYTPIQDRIVAGTILCAVAITGGNVRLKYSNSTQIRKLIEILSRMGCQINVKSDIIELTSDGNLHSIAKVETGYYPDFPTDLQSIMLTLCALVHGETEIVERVFESRFLIVPELVKMGANIEVFSNRRVKVVGVDSLSGACLQAKELRGGASLVLAGLRAKGETIIDNVHFIDRGYEQIESMFTSLGADIERV